MKPGIINWLRIKISIWRKDASRKGHIRVFLDYFHEYVNKRKFGRMGVSFTEDPEVQSNTLSNAEFKDVHANQPSSFYTLKKAFSHIDQKPENISLLDIGCGSGRVLSYAMLLNFRKVFGIDLDENGIEKAISNCTQMQKNGFTTIFNIQIADATRYDLPEGINVIYMFNPFGEQTMKTDLNNIITYCTHLNKSIYLIYCNPVYINLFEEKKECEKLYECYFKNKTREMVIYSIKPIS
jgi:predicted RNA methylase